MDTDATWIRVVEARGFGGLEAGEGMVLARDGTSLGGLLQGLLNRDLLQLADELLNGTREALTVGFSVGDLQAIVAGFVCGGEVELLAQRLRTVPEALWSAVAAGRPATVVTVCSGSAAGVTAVVDDHGLHGDQRLAELGVGEVLAHHAGLVGARARRRILFVAGQTVLLDVVLPKVQLVVFGRRRTVQRTLRAGQVTRLVSVQGR
jgi:xanthine/CO dehydrogenase XdhC/CoxF family maturation factor